MSFQNTKSRKRLFDEIERASFQCADGDRRVPFPLINTFMSDAFASLAALAIASSPIARIRSFYLAVSCGVIGDK